MNQMNISITDELSGFVRDKVASGRYNNASEVVREALRRMEEEDQRALRLADPTVEDLLSNLSESQLSSIRSRVLAGIAAVGKGDFAEYEGRTGLAKLSDQVKTRGRKRSEARA
jgi:antitoxin ParD1/3/4